MAKPVILAVDDDPQVLRAVERDLRRKYAREYRVLRADSGESALDALDKLKLRGDPVALFLVDQRMPRMTGVEFLERAVEIFPEAKRDLLTAYADTDAAIRAINEVGLDYYLQKPWDPPEEHLYPILDDQLDDWQADFKPPFEGVRVVGDRWSPDSHRIRDFLARNRVSYRWLDVESSEEARQIVERLDYGAPKLPVVVFPDGETVGGSDERILAAIEHHDRPYQIWKKMKRKGRLDEDALEEVFERVPDHDLFLRFIEVDGSSEAKDQEPIEWLRRQMQRRELTEPTVDR